MKQIFLALLIAVVIAGNDNPMHFHGLEDVVVTIQVEDNKWTFQGVITILPHSRNVALYFCDVEENNGKKNLLELFGLTDEKDSMFPLIFESRAMLIPFQRYEKFVRRDRNDKKLNRLTLTELDEKTTITIDYQSAEDRQYTSLMIEHLQDNLGDTTYDFLKEYDDVQIVGQDEYIQKFCQRYQVREQREDDL